MNYHFTTTKAHFELAGGKVLEIYTDEALKTESDHPFKGNMDLDKLRAVIAKEGAKNVAFVRMEATTNLIGGQPFSMANLKDVRKVAAAARHPRDHRLQPDLRKRLFHQAPRAGLRRRLGRRRSCAR